MRSDHDHTPERILARHDWAGEDYQKEFAGLDAKGRLQKLIDRRRWRVLLLKLRQDFRATLTLPKRPPKRKRVHLPGQSPYELDTDRLASARQQLIDVVNHWEPCHLWYLDATLENYELRPGHPPIDRERPVWLRGIALELDPDRLSPAHLAKLLPEGEFDQMIRDQAQQNSMLDRQGAKSTLDTKVIEV